MKIIYLITTCVFFTCVGCIYEDINVLDTEKEPKLKEDFALDTLQEYGHRATCIPFHSVKIDPDFDWQLGQIAGEQENGKGEAIVGRFHWTASALAVIEDNILGIALIRFHNEEYPAVRVERLSFNLHLPINRCVELATISAFVDAENPGWLKYSLTDDDIPINRYSVDEERVSLIEVDKLDLENRKVSGKFSVHLVSDYEVNDPIIPKAISFLNGSFSCDILN